MQILFDKTAVAGIRHTHNSHLPPDEPAFRADNSGFDTTGRKPGPRTGYPAVYGEIERLHKAGFSIRGGTYGCLPLWGNGRLTMNMS